MRQNRSNFKAHYEGTGPEIWRQTNGKVDAFVSGAGTGGTIAGTGKYLKDMNEDIRVVLSDPDGSGLYNKVCPRMCHSCKIMTEYISPTDQIRCDVRLKGKGGYKKAAPSRHGR